MVRHDSSLRAVTFDVTGTLVHSPRRNAVYAEVLGRHGVRVPPIRLRRLIPEVWRELSCGADMGSDRFSAEPGGARAYWHRFLARLCQRLEVDEPSRFASAELFHRFGRAEVWEVYPDVAPTLDALVGAGLRLGVVSNWDCRLPALLTELGLSRWFAVVATSGASGVEKPHPRLFQHCLDGLAVGPEQALHVGDSAREDVEGAVAVGMRAILVDRGDPDFRLDRFLEPYVEPSRPTRGPREVRHARV